LRQVSVRYIATGWITNIIVYAAAEAEAQEQIWFNLKIFKQTGFRTSAGKMFKVFVLSWLYAHSNGYINCIGAQDTSASLQIPACRDKQTIFFHQQECLEEEHACKEASTVVVAYIPTFPHNQCYCLD
jgi:hypothetical protein